jgi:hypothetical protein
MRAFGLGIRLAVLALASLAAAEARAVMVTYTATLATSKGNPVTHVLILESDGVHPVQASVYPSEIAGHGTVFIRHDAPFQPTRSIVIGITEGVSDVDGSDKTQIVMFLDPQFVAANEGVPFSSVFPGARHNETITRLLAAAGDDAELAWFTDTFFDGPAAGAAFASGGAFTVAEFSNTSSIGRNATAGNWMITGFRALEQNHPDAQSGQATADVEESAKSPGPFDIQLLIGVTAFAVDKTVTNDTGLAWSRFVLELGTGLGPAFVTSTAGDGIGFDETQNNREETGTFPTLVVEEDRIVFSGFLAPGATARFVVFVQANPTQSPLVTIRQSVVAAPSPAPALGSFTLGLLVVALCALAALRLPASGRLNA